MSDVLLSILAMVSTFEPNYTDYSYGVEETTIIPKVLSDNDIFQLTVVSLMFIVGTPVNLCAIVNIIGQFKTNKTRLLWLQLHLCIADLTVLLFFALPQILWIGTLEFLGDDFSCKLVKFLSLFSLYLSSNIVACTSLDRSMTVTNPMRFSMNSTKLVKIFTLISWILAVVCSAPQFGFWQIYILPFDDGFEAVRHCTNIQKISQLEQNSSDPNRYNHIWLGYTCFHLITVFWLPLLIMIVSYANILRVVSTRHSFMNSTTKRVSLTRLHMARSSYLAIEVCLNTSMTASTRLFHSRSQNLSHRNIEESLKLIEMSHNSIKGSDNLQPQPLLSKKISNRFASSKAKFMTALIVISYVTCWLPYNLINIWALIDTESDALKLTNIFYYLIILNTIINPCIYYYHYLCRFVKRLRFRDVSLSSTVL